jgi:hypothetical protein
MRFLPEDYEAPKTSNNYMKLEEGENRIRILSAPEMGWEDWIENKPRRYEFGDKPIKSYDPKKPVRHFWAFIVWNYNDERIQILHVTQATIRSGIEGLCNDKDWGEPFFYDIKIIKKGEGVDTQYAVNPSPHKPLATAIKQEFMDNRCCLKALFVGSDPFSKEWEGQYTEGIFEQEQQPKPELKPIQLVTKDEIIAIGNVLMQCGPDYTESITKYLLDQGIANYEEMPRAMYNKIYNSAVKKSKEKVA